MFGTTPASGQDFSHDGNNIFPLAPRELRQVLAHARASLDEQRFSDAVAQIGEVLDAAGSGDFFLGTPGTPDAQISLKTEALALLGSMPPRGRQMYELQYGADAKAALEAALQAGDLAQLTEVSRRYFHTKAGYEATLLLGRYQLDQGRPLSAALTLKRVADVPIALEQYDPELSVLLATCWLHASQPEDARQTLLSLKERLPGAKVRLVDRQTPLFSKDTEALDWLQSIVGGSRSAQSAAAKQWVLYRGDERRNAQSSGGVPLLNFNWKLPTVNDPADEGRVAQRYRALRDGDQPLVCALEPLIVQDYAIVRQPESNKLIGINLKKQGKREWVYPLGDDMPVEQIRAIQTSRAPNANNRDEELKQRIWEDHAFGQVSSDGRRVFVIDDLSYAPMANVNIPNVWIGRGGRQIQNPNSAKNYNQLVALDLHKQGYILWAVGGTTSDIPALAGAFFLGPPLPAGDQLFALAEFGGEIRLLCLDAKTGGLEWKQQLAVLQEEQYHIQNDRNRRLAGASPSLGEGIIVCPTSAGAVVAVDLATRTLRWGYQYVRNDTSPYPQGGMRWRGPGPQVTNNPNGGWLDATTTIADRSVVLTPPESQQLHCLDLLTGKARWAPIPRDEMLFVACIHDGKIILVGKNRVKAINLSDGKPAWPAEIKLDNELVTGRGYYNDHYYYLPTTGREICKLDLNSGTIADRARTEVELGNVACYQNELVSISPESVASFVLLSKDLEKQLTERLAGNPQDLEALSLKAQILLQQDQADESLALLRRASELAPDEPGIRNLLVKVMISLVRHDHTAHVALTDELDKLVTDPVQRREILRWRVQGLVESDRPWDAFTAILELADQELSGAAVGPSPAPLQPVERERNVRSDRWLQGQLKRLYERADSDLRGRMTAELTKRLEHAKTSGGLSPLRAFLNLFGFHELGDAARLALVDRLINADGYLEAEVLAGELLDRQDPATSGAAHGALVSIYKKAKRPDLAARMAQVLATRFGKTVVHDGQTGQQLATQILGEEALRQAIAAWPVGEVEVSEATASNSFGPRIAYPLHVAHYSGSAPRGLKVAFDTTKFEISIRGETGQVLATAQLHGANTARPMYFPGSNPSAIAQANGHLVVVSMGSEIAAVDGLRTDRSGESLLWKFDVADSEGAIQNGRMSSSVRVRNPLLGNRSAVVDTSGRTSVTAGPVSSTGVAYLRGRQLTCVDALTGQTLWERSSTTQAEFPQQAEIFGDGDLLFIADARANSKSDEAIVLSAIDGSFVDKRQLPLADKRWATHGREVLSFDEAGAGITLKLRDVWTDNELWKRQVPSGSRGHIIDGEELAILEPGGQFTVVSLASGQPRFSVPLEAQRGLSWIQVMRSRDQYLLLASQDGGPSGGSTLQPLPIAGSMHAAAMHGRVYAFDRTTGKLAWQTAAFVSHHFLPPDQPTESPLLLFVAQRNANNKSSAAVLALDRRTGHGVYEKDLNGSPATTCEIAADAEKQTVTLSLIGQPARSVVFHFTDKPRPPQPPAQTGEMASSTAGRAPGMPVPGLGEAIDVLTRGLDPRAFLMPQPK
jgi:outer membrane protein assembly factor BamB